MNEMQENVVERGVQKCHAKKSTERGRDLLLLLRCNFSWQNFSSIPPDQQNNGA